MSLNAETASGALLAVEGLTERYRPRIGGADVSVDLWPGEALGIVGEAPRLLGRLAAAAPDRPQPRHRPAPCLHGRADREIDVSAFPPAKAV